VEEVGCVRVSITNVGTAVEFSTGISILYILSHVCDYRGGWDW
jgi:hypothetical protein